MLDIAPEYSYLFVCLFVCYCATVQPSKNTDIHATNETKSTDGQLRKTLAAQKLVIVVYCKYICIIGELGEQSRVRYAMTFGTGT